MEKRLRSESVTRTLRASFSALAFGEAAARAFSFFAVLLLARRLGPGAFGTVTLGTTLVAWFGLVADSGTELVGVRDVSRNPAQVRHLCDRVLGLRLAVALPAAAVFALVASQVGRPGDQRTTLVLFAVVLPALAFNVRWMVLGVRGARAVAVGNIVSKAVLLAVVVLVVAGPRDLRSVPFLFLGAELAYGLVILALLARRLGVIVPRVDLAVWRSTLRQGFPLLAVSVVRATSFSVDVIAVGLVLGTHDVGVYGAAAKPALFATSAIGLFSVSFLSTYSGAARREGDDLLRTSLRPLLACSLVAAVGLSAAAAAVVPLLFGHAYAAAVPVLAILAWRIPLTAFGSPYGTVLIAHRRQDVLLRNNAVGAALGIAGCFALAPVAGLAGVAAARVASSAVTTFLNYRTSTSLELAPRLRGDRTLLAGAAVDA
ncbi:MAG TPA: oligosaccharide flippase family protein [Gaiellaceae bacterium]|nr:oligosaccharide flippase family protein [Gaiellaceae bacterium]